MVSAEHHQPGPRANAFDQHFLLLGADIRAVQVADDKNVELVDGFLVVGNGRQLEPFDVRAFEEHVGPRLHQGEELQVGVLGQKAIDQCPVLRPQGPFEIQHVNARLDDQRGRRALIILDDLFFWHGRNADGVGVPAFEGGAKIELRLVADRSPD